MPGTARTLPAADGYRGIWYFCNGQKGPYKYKYSGGLGTYCAKHIPLAVHAPAAEKTFFVYGGRADDENRLLHMVSFYDHRTGRVPRPRVLLDKQTADAHDNPVLMLDEEGYVYIFSSAHGVERAAYISRGVEPYAIDAFERIYERNFSYPQPWPIPGRGFLWLHTLYRQGHRFLHYSTGSDGRQWDGPHPLATIRHGHYQVSWRRGGTVGTAFNVHPETGVDWRENLYYLETPDLGRTWRTAAGQAVETPLTETDNPARAYDSHAEGLLVYLKDLNFDAAGRPVALVVRSPGAAPGPENNPRRWTTVHWTGEDWRVRGRIESDSNYDTGCLHVEADGTWRIIGPTDPGPQPFNPGGEMAMWTSADEGASWTKVRRMTGDSEFNHTYARRPVGAHEGFYAFWADGHGLEVSPSRLYFCDRAGQAFRLPPEMKGDWAEPEPVK